MVNSEKNPSRLNLFVAPVLRFTMELTAWLWLLMAGFILNYLYFLLLFLSITVLASMNFPTDKTHDGPISVSGWLRIFNELVFAGLASIFASYLLFGIRAFLVQLLLVILVIIFDFQRYLWMLGFRTYPPLYVTYWKTQHK